MKAYPRPTRKINMSLDDMQKMHGHLVEVRYLPAFFFDGNKLTKTIYILFDNFGFSFF
jgi:hypothetical protein